MLYDGHIVLYERCTVFYDRRTVLNARRPELHERCLVLHGRFTLLYESRVALHQCRIDVLCSKKARGGHFFTTSGPLELVRLQIDVGLADAVGGRRTYCIVLYDRRAML